jgi:hypothetical protein
MMIDWRNRNWTALCPPCSHGEHAHCTGFARQDNFRSTLGPFT